MRDLATEWLDPMIGLFTLRLSLPGPSGNISYNSEFVENKNFSKGFMTRLLVVDDRAIGYHLQMFFRQNQLQLFKHLPIFPAKTNYDLSLSEFFRHHWTNNFITDTENRNRKPCNNSSLQFQILAGGN